MYLPRLLSSVMADRSRTTGSAPAHMISRRCLGAAILLCVFTAVPVFAQTGGEGGIQGSVLDSAGAAIPNVTITATNQATGISTTRTSTGSGVFSLVPIQPGVYTVTAKATGFEAFKQENLTVDALKTTGFNITLQIGSETQTVEVTTAPPQLETTNASLGLTIENTTYANLPLPLNNAQRDPTAFGALAPGAQGGARLPIIGGTGNYLGQLYLDGLPAETVSQQGDNRLISQAVSVDAVDQIQVITSTPSAEYSGAGAENFTVKSGGLKYHGQASDFIRNTAFDAWPFLVKEQTVPALGGGTMPAPKPIDHQNEFSFSAGGHVPGTKRVFFFGAYDRYHNRTLRGPANYTVPTALEKAGDFTELNGGVGSGGLTGTGANNPAFLFNPTTTACVGSTCTRQPFMGLKNGVPTYNVIPAGYISPQAQFLQSFLPNPTNASTLTNNYTGSLPGGYDNYSVDYRIDFDINSRHRVSTVGALGEVGYLNNFAAPYLPLPYTGGDYADIFPKNFDVQDTYTFSNAIVNQLKFGFVRFYQNIHNDTQNSPYSISNSGISNLPAGQAGQEFPGISFATTSAFSTALQTFTTNSNSTATQVTTPNNFTLVDNLQILKGPHAITFGIQVQWQEINNANPATYTGILSLPFTGYSTARFGSATATSGSSLYLGAAGVPSGYSYASFLLGAVGGTPSLGLQPVAEVGGRYRPISPYIEDSWKATPKLTVDAGLRWDYLPPYHEVKDRWSFLNPTLTNPATGTPGALEFAGSTGGAGVSCGCRTPVQTYFKNFGPRVGVTYSFTPKTVGRVGAGHVFSQGGGVGGRGGAYQGTGQLGFNTTATGQAEITSYSGTGALPGPSFYLNSGSAFTAAGLANTSLFGAGYAYPTAPAIGPASQILDTGNYLTSSGAFVNPSAAPGYADPYFSGRAPDFTFYNLGVEQAFTQSLTLAINYVGNQSHHLIDSTNSGTGNARGYWVNQLNPIYLAGLANVTDVTGKQSILTAAATPANVAKAQAAMPGMINIPTYFQNAAAVKSTASIAQGLVAFPQYSSVADTYGANVGNFSYNSLQVSLDYRLSHGLTFNANYTWSSNIGDDGPFRTGFALPSGSVSGTSQAYRMDRIDRDKTTVTTPQSFHTYAVYKLPFGKVHFGGGNALVRNLVDGFQVSGIYTYASGTPFQVIAANCTATNSPLQGQCMPNLNPNFSGNARQNGGYGRGSNGRTACNLGVGTMNGAACTAVQYINPNAFSLVTPQNATTGTLLIGNAPRTGAYGLTNPGSQDLDLALKRRFALPGRENMMIEIEADLFNALNHTNFSGLSTPGSSNTNATVGSAAFGTITGVANTPRGLELAGHFNF